MAHHRNRQEERNGLDLIQKNWGTGVRVTKSCVMCADAVESSTVVTMRQGVIRRPNRSHSLVEAIELSTRDGLKASNWIAD